MSRSSCLWHCKTHLSLPSPCMFMVADIQSRRVPILPQIYARHLFPPIVGLIKSSTRRNPRPEKPRAERFSYKSGVSKTNAAWVEHAALNRLNACYCSIPIKGTPLSVRTHPGMSSQPLIGMKSCETDIQRLSFRSSLIDKTQKRAALGKAGGSEKDMTRADRRKHTRKNTPIQCLHLLFLWQPKAGIRRYRNSQEPPVRLKQDFSPLTVVSVHCFGWTWIPNPFIHSPLVTNYRA